MKPSVSFARTVVHVETDSTVHTLIELEAPSAPEVKRPPLDIAVVIDRSGSMGGRPIESVIEATSLLIRLLTPRDRISVIAFGSDVELILDLDHHDATKAIHRVQQIGISGSTNMSGGLLKAIEVLENSVRDDAIRRIVLLTDGHANVGVTEPGALCGFVSGAKVKNITTSTIGFDDGFDEELLSSLADAGAGNDYWCAGADHVPEIFRDEFDGLASLVAQNISVEIRPNPEVKEVRVLNEYPITPVKGGLQIALGDAYGEEKRKVVAEFDLPVARKDGPFPLGEIIIRWTSVIGDTELCSVTIPIGVGISTNPDAPDPDADPAVTEYVNVLRAAQERKSAVEALRSGDYDSALKNLTSAIQFLEATDGDSLMIAELRDDVSRIQSGEWSASDSKRQWSNSRSEFKGRKRRYDS